MTVDQLRAAHDPRQHGVPPDHIRIADGIVIPCVPEARHGFEFFCWRCPEMAEEMTQFIEEARGKHLFLDVGALHGVFALVFMALNPDGLVYAFEPHPASFAILQRNCASFRNITPIQAALSSSKGEIMMREEWGIHLVAAEEGVPVPTVTGDSYRDADLIKIDVEGYELEVLRGLKKTLASRPALLIEVHPVRVGNNMDTLKALLESHGYPVDHSFLPTEQDFRLVLK